jgi:anti-sigma factor (TIGR02949 family)
MKCVDVRSLFSSYLDGAVSGKQMRNIADHLALCPSCSSEYDATRRTQALVASIGKRRAPSDLALRLRLAIQHERTRKYGTLQGFVLRLEHAFNSFMLPATAGLVSAVIIFGLLIGLFASPQLNVQNDVSTALYLPPRLTSAPYGLIGINEPVVLEAYVSSEGRVEDYRIISGPKESDSLRVQLDNALIFATFEPARAFGMPSSGRVVITFEKRNLGI